MRTRDLTVPYPTVLVDNDAGEAARLMTGQSVTEWLPRGRFPTAAVAGPVASPTQIAAPMTRQDTSTVAVVERDGGKATLIGAVTAAALLEHFIGGP